MSARTATTGPGRPPRRIPTTPVWATPVRTSSKPSARRWFATSSAVLNSRLPSSGCWWMCSRRRMIESCTRATAASMSGFWARRGVVGARVRAAAADRAVKTRTVMVRFRSCYGLASRCNMGILGRVCLRPPPEFRQTIPLVRRARRIRTRHFDVPPLQSRKQVALPERLAVPQAERGLDLPPRHRALEHGQQSRDLGGCLGGYLGVWSAARMVSTMYSMNLVLSPAAELSRIAR